MKKLKLMGKKGRANRIVRSILSFDDAPDIPDSVGSDWLIFNASRPLPVEKNWRSDFYHGAFYGAVDPTSLYALENIRRIVELDGYLWRVVHQEDYAKWLHQKRAHYGNDVVNKILVNDKDELPTLFLNELIKKLNNGDDISDAIFLDPGDPNSLAEI